MEKISAMKAVILTVVGSAGSFVVNWFGGWTEDLTTLLIFMGIDYVIVMGVPLPNAITKAIDVLRNKSEGE